ncbi:MAG: hypothetical protein M3R63_06645, partial [Actinomycetota bacterium]|nr:hypothetical protein [Actinomycetota bacterium]
AVVLRLAQHETDKADDLARQVAHQASPLQRRAHTVRLRALRDHHPDLPGLDHVIAIIDPEAAASLTDRERRADHVRRSSGGAQRRRSAPDVQGVAQPGGRG